MSALSFKIDASYQFGYYFYLNSDVQYRVIFSCPNENCLELFIGHYDLDSNRNIRYRGIAPYNFIAEKFDERIKEISPGFVEIYNQSLSAENKKLLRYVEWDIENHLNF